MTGLKCRAGQGIALSFLLILAVFTWVPSAVAAADTVKIGILEPFSGPFEYGGRAFVAGLNYVIDEQNAKGGLLGKKIELVTEDSEMKADVAVRKAKKLILEDKVDLFGLGYGSQNAIALNKVATSYKKIFINYATRADVVQGKEFSRYAFRTCMTSYNLTTTLVQYMASKPYRKYYMLNMDYAYGRDVARAFREQIKIHIPDAQIVGEDFHPINNKDFAPYISKVIAAKADIIFTGNLGNDLILLVKQARSLGLKVPFPFAVTIGIDPYLCNELKDDVAGIYSTISNDMRANIPEWQEIVKKFHEKHKNDKDFLTWWPFSLIGEAIIGWNMTFAAIAKAGSLDPEKIIETFEGFDYKSPIGPYHMRKCDHQAILPMFAGVTQVGPNPFFNGSIRPDVKFPWIGPDMLSFPGDKVVIPATAEYNPRCK